VENIDHQLLEIVRISDYEIDRNKLNDKIIFYLKIELVNVYCMDQ
jgi:hypothetical protein